MYDDWGVNSAVVAGTIVAVVVCVLIHYEGLSLLARRRLQRGGEPQRRRVLFDILAIMALHVTEIWLFGLTYWMLLMIPGAGSIVGSWHPGLLDAVYLSAVTYTTVGFGDVAPQGPIRLLAGTEALCGFVLITWSASFTFLEMERHWRR